MAPATFEGFDGVQDLIIDTDISIDVDDVGMLCAAHALVDLGEARILAMLHDSHATYGVGAISAINRYFGRDGIPIGAYSGPIGQRGPRSAFPEFTNTGQGWYAKEIAEQFPSPIRTVADAEEALPVFRRALESAADGSVTLVAVGFLTNVLALLRSPGGVALVQRKIKRVVIMGGIRECPGFDAGCPAAEWNIAGCGGKVNEWEQSQHGGCGDFDTLGAISHDAIELWPTTVPIVWTSWETGTPMKTGASMFQKPEIAASPCGVAYKLFCTTMREREPWLGDRWCTADHGRSSYDPLSLVYAVRGNRNDFWREEKGSNLIDSSTGVNTWRANAAGHQSYLIAKRDLDVIADHIDELLARRPLHENRQPPIAPPPAPPQIPPLRPPPRPPPSPPPPPPSPPSPPSPPLPSPPPPSPLTPPSPQLPLSSPSLSLMPLAIAQGTSTSADSVANSALLYAVGLAVMLIGAWMLVNELMHFRCKKSDGMVGGSTHRSTKRRGRRSGEKHVETVPLAGERI